MKTTNFTFLILLLFLALSTSLFAQKTMIKGKATDLSTGQALPFVNISFQDSKIGTTTDFDGNYQLETYYATHSIIASFVGFKRITFKVKKDIEQYINFELESSQVNLKEFQVSSSKKDKSNPALDLLDKVIENKDANNRVKLDAYEYEVYNKIEFDVNNIPENLRNKKALKPFEFIFDGLDTSSEKPYIPMFMTETVSDYIFINNPQSSKEIIRASKVSGLENESISQFLGDMYQNVNIYDNFVVAFRKNFVSPIASFGKLSYNYYLIDSGIREDVFCYKLTFSPKRKGELTFIGDIWIADTSYAIKEVNISFAKDANINFLNTFKVNQVYSQVEREVWMLTEDKLLLDFNISDKQMGFYGRKKSTYQDFIINKPRPRDFFSSVDNVDVIKGAASLSEAVWDSLRHNPLSSDEKRIYNMVDSLRHIPQFNTYLDVITLLVSGYWINRNFEYGPYFTFYSFNKVEGNRFKFGFRTSNDFSTWVMPNAYVAYGILDKKLKYGLGFQLFLSKEPRRKLYGQFANDVEQLGTSENAWKNDNILASLFRRSPVTQLNAYHKYEISYEREWFQGFENKLTFNTRELWSITPNLKFEELDNSNWTSAGNLNFTEISLLTRFAYKEKYVNGEFERVSLGTIYPILQTKFTYGLKGVLNSTFEYQKLQISVTDRIRFGYIGQTEVNIEAGKIWGEVPFPILELHNGNETYFYDPASFNLMNFYEFASDQWASLSLTHHFNGLFFNKIPMISKLKLREVASFKMVAGKLNPSNQTILKFPSTLKPLSKPYAETGIGIENILKVFRVDALWRLSYLNNPNIAKFGIRMAIQIDF